MYLNVRWIYHHLKPLYINLLSCLNYFRPKMQSQNTPRINQDQTRLLMPLSPTSHLNTNTPFNSPTHSSNPNTLNQPNPEIICLVIPLRAPINLLQDMDNSPPLPNNAFHQLANLYELYLHYPTSTKGPTLCWMNLTRGILNNASWTTHWAQLVHRALSKSLLNQQQQITLHNLQI